MRKLVMQELGFCSASLQCNFCAFLVYNEDREWGKVVSW